MRPFCAKRVVEAERRAEDPVLDEATLTRAVGVETAKILWTAHDAAGNLVAKAEDRAAELIAEAGQVLAQQTTASEAEALQIRVAAEQEAAEYTSRAKEEADSITNLAHADAVELFDATKEECRRMVAEDRGLRNRALADLVARRRRSACTARGAPCREGLAVAGRGRCRGVSRGVA